jgi:TPR repeat protein
MKQWLLSALLLAICAPWIESQSITIDLAHPQNGRYERRFGVEAANHDPSANTPKKIAQVNLALAKDGNTDAAWQLALAYLQGYGVKQDLTQAKHWFQIGAIKPEQKSLVAEMYQNGEYFPESLDAAADWFTSAGRPSDLFEIAQAYRMASPPQTARAAALYVALLKESGHPEVRRAQMELGNFVLDGKYTAGPDVTGRALNLEWARTIAQELLGQEEYKIAVDYSIGRSGLPPDKTMWLRFCGRAAAYNIDLAQIFYAQAITEGTAPNPSGYDDVAWTRLASDKQSGEIAKLRAMESGMNAQQRRSANAVYESFLQTRVASGAYYLLDDPLRDPVPDSLAAVPPDDPDQQLRFAFELEKKGQTDDEAYRRAMDIYRTVRDSREMDARFVLGRNCLNGTNGIQKNAASARYWLHEAAGRGSKPAQQLLTTLPDTPSPSN